MEIFQKQFIEDAITTDPWYLNTLQAVRQLHLRDWAIGAGFVRTAVCRAALVRA